jgi:hypothetical protein
VEKACPSFSVHEADHFSSNRKNPVRPNKPIWHTNCSDQVMENQHGKGIPTVDSVVRRKKGMGPDSAGQSGDTQGLSDVAEAGPESVLELMEEGQSFEAEAIAGVEDASDPDVAEVHTKQFPEDDVPAEYQGKDD